MQSDAAMTAASFFIIVACGRQDKNLVFHTLCQSGSWLAGSLRKKETCAGGTGFLALIFWK